MVIKTGTNGEIFMIVYVGQTPGDNGGQGSLACCSLWGHKESDTA